MLVYFNGSLQLIVGVITQEATQGSDTKVTFSAVGVMTLGMRDRVKSDIGSSGCDDLRHCSLQSAVV